MVGWHHRLNGHEFEQAPGVSRRAAVHKVVKSRTWLSDWTELIPTHTHTNTMEYYSAIKNNVWSFAKTWIDLESIMLSEINQTEKGKYRVILLIFAIWKQNTQTLQNRNILIDTENNRVVARAERWGYLWKRDGD